MEEHDCHDTFRGQILAIRDTINKVNGKGVVTRRRLRRVEGRVNQMEERLNSMEARLSALEQEAEARLAADEIEPMPSEPQEIEDE